MLSRRQRKTEDRRTDIAVYKERWNIKNQYNGRPSKPEDRIEATGKAERQEEPV